MMMGAGWGWHWLWMLGFWTVVIGLVAWAVVRLAPASPTEGRARRILDERYARGEIDDEEYRHRSAALGR